MAKQLGLSVFIEDDGSLVPCDAAGNRILSPTRHGENATADEAWGMLTAAHRKPMPDAPRDDQGRFSRKTMPRKEFEALHPRDRARMMQEAGYTLELTD